MRELGLARIRVGHHRPELVEREGAAVRTPANLPEEDRPGRVELDQQGDDSEERHEHDQGRDGRDEIECPLQEAGRSGQRERREPDE